MIVEHLVKQGCRRIAHIGGYKHTRIFNNRIRGYFDALKNHDLPLKPKKNMFEKKKIVEQKNVG